MIHNQVVLEYNPSQSTADNLDALHAQVLQALGRKAEFTRRVQALRSSVMIAERQVCALYLAWLREKVIAFASYAQESGRGDMYQRAVEVLARDNHNSTDYDALCAEFMALRRAWSVTQSNLRTRAFAPSDMDEVTGAYLVECNRLARQAGRFY